MQRFIFKDMTGDSNPLMVVRWNEAITWAVCGVLVTNVNSSSHSLLSRICLRRSIQEMFASGPSLPLEDVMEDEQIGDSLIKAIMDGDIEIMGQLLGSDADSYFVREVTGMALFKVVERGDQAAIRSILSQRVVNTQDGFQRTALHLACMQGQEILVNLLLDFGADKHMADWFGHKPLYYKTQFDHDWMFGTIDTPTLTDVERLIQDEADANASRKPFDGRKSWTTEVDKHSPIGNRRQLHTYGVSGPRILVMVKVVG